MPSFLYNHLRDKMCYGFKEHVKTTYWNCYTNLQTNNKLADGNLLCDFFRDMYNNILYTVNIIENKSYCYSVLKEIIERTKKPNVYRRFKIWLAQMRESITGLDNSDLAMMFMLCVVFPVVIFGGIGFCIYDTFQRSETDRIRNELIINVFDKKAENFETSLNDIMTKDGLTIIGTDILNKDGTKVSDSIKNEYIRKLYAIKMPEKVTK